MPIAVVPPDRLAYSVAEAAELIGLSRSGLYLLVRSGEVASFKIGRARRIRPAAIVAFLDALEAEQAAKAAEARR